MFSYLRTLKHFVWNVRNFLSHREVGTKDKIGSDSVGTPVKNDEDRRRSEFLLRRTRTQKKSLYNILPHARVAMAIRRRFDCAFGFEVLGTSTYPF